MTRPDPRGEIVADLAGLERLEGPWWALWRRSSSTPFQTPAWLIAWWRSFAPGQLATVAVWEEEQLIGLAPFYLEQDGGHVRLLPLGISVSDYLDFLVDPARSGAAAKAIAAATGSLGWNFCSLEELPADGAAAALLRSLPGSVHLSDHHACPVVPLAGPPDLSGCVPARRRRQLRRAWAAAERRGKVEISPSNDQPHGFLDELIRLHSLRWTTDGGGVLSDPAVTAFHRDALPKLVGHGLARCWLLSIAGRCVGACYGLQHAGRAYAYLGGYDPDYAAESPGSILIGHAIAEAVREGMHEFDFLRGRESYKYSWGARDRWTKRALVARAMAA